ncbi:MAG: nucleotidyltransferase family protein [Vicinamibacterales bacterium]
MTDVRRRVCACLRDDARPAGCVPADVVAAARADDVHLLLADRLRLPVMADELRAAALVEAIREHELRAVLARLADAGVRAILLKGAALAYTCYARPELRPRDDTDVMIPRSSRAEVARTLTAAGYHQPSEVDGDLTTGQFHWQRRDGHGLLHALDIHWRVSNVRAFADVLTFEELAGDAIAVPDLGLHAWSPSPVHALLVACVHRVAHHGDTPNLLWLFDVHLLASKLSQHQRAAFRDLASARKVRAVCGRSLHLAQEAFGGIDVDWIASLAEPSGAVESTAAFLGGHLRPVDILKSDLAATRSWRARLQLLAEHLFPSSAFMYERYGTRLKLALPFLYLHRAVRGMPKWFRR